MCSADRHSLTDTNQFAISSMLDNHVTVSADRQDERSDNHMPIVGGRKDVLFNNHLPVSGPLDNFVSVSGQAGVSDNYLADLAKRHRLLSDKSILGEPWRALQEKHLVGPPDAPCSVPGIGDN